MYIPSVREQFFLEVRWLSENTVLVLLFKRQSEYSDSSG